MTLLQKKYNRHNQANRNRIYNFIKDRCDGQLFASSTTNLANECFTSKMTLIRHLHALKEENLIKQFNLGSMNGYTTNDVNECLPVAYFKDYDSCRTEVLLPKKIHEFELQKPNTTKESRIRNKIAMNVYSTLSDLAMGLDGVCFRYNTLAEILKLPKEAVRYHLQSLGEKNIIKLAPINNKNFCYLVKPISGKSAKINAIISKDIFSTLKCA